MRETLKGTPHNESIPIVVLLQQHSALLLKMRIPTSLLVSTAALLLCSSPDSASAYSLFPWQYTTRQASSRHRHASPHYRRNQQQQHQTSPYLLSQTRERYSSVSFALSVPTESPVEKSWHRNVLQRITFRQQQSTATASRTTTSSNPTAARHPQQQQQERFWIINEKIDFVQTKFELQSPSMVPALPALSPWVKEVDAPQVSSSLDDDSLTTETSVEVASSPEALAEDLPSSSSRFTRFTAGWVQNALAKRFHRWSKGRHVDMNVFCSLKSLDVRRGKLHCDASVDVGRIIFNAIRFSGGRIEAAGLTLNLFTFLPGVKRRSQKRFPHAFDLVAHNCTLTQHDLMESPCIRNGLRRLFTRILDIRGMNAVFVRLDDITIMDGKLCCQGTATTILGASVPFEVRTGLGFASRGHVLTFPGLELSLGKLEFFVPVLPEVTVDLGHKAALHDIQFLPTGAVQVSARVTITPVHTMHLPPHYRQAASSYAAQCSVDVGRWLTKLGKFSL